MNNDGLKGFEHKTCDLKPCALHTMIACFGGSIVRTSKLSGISMLNDLYDSYSDSPAL